jgi:hypothetical protein
LWSSCDPRKKSFTAQQILRAADGEQHAVACFIVMNEADCCSTKHNACSDDGRGEGCASASDADLPRVALEGGVRAKLQRGQIILEFRRTRGVEASTPFVSRRRIR